MSPEELGLLFPVVITEYNPGWPLLFKKEKESLEDGPGSGNIVSIEHIGSTAVPGLPAKPVIDILIEIDSSDDSIKNYFRTLGYHFIHRPDNPPPHMMFVKGYTIQGYSGQAYHVHVRYRGDWNEIYFRDYLTRHTETAREYADLKYKLAKKYVNDREGYTRDKTKFVEYINALARSESQTQT